MKKIANTDNSMTFSIRLDRSLCNRIKEQAVKDGKRSANSLIVSILEAGVCHLELPPRIKL